MGRLRTETLERLEAYSDRVLDVVVVLESKKAHERILDQLTGSGTSAGANTWEANEAMSEADFCKTLSTAIKELNETRFWLRLVVRRGWITAKRLRPLEEETVELIRMFGAMVHRTRQRTTKRPKRDS